MALSEQEREYQRQYKQRIRDAFVASRGGACERCGADPGAYGLVVDYADLSTKPGYASKIWSMGRERREAELEKCIVLCRACHLVHTEPPHGTLARARRFKDKCTCQGCKDAENVYQRSWAARRRAYKPRRISTKMLDEPWREELKHFPTEAPQVPENGWWNDLGRDDTLADDALGNSQTQ
jgi:hypothetical protein